MQSARLSWLLRGMAEDQEKKVARPRCGIDDRGAAALRDLTAIHGSSRASEQKQTGVSIYDL
jgi:hypothetical protein